MADRARRTRPTRTGFDYPTLVPDADGAVPGVAGRAVVPRPRGSSCAVLGVAAVAAAWWLGRAAYGRVGGRSSPQPSSRSTTIGVAYSHMAVTDVPMTLADRGLARARRSAGRLELAGLAAGLATARSTRASSSSSRSSSPAGASGGASRSRSRPGGRAFLATSPYVLVHPGQAWDDATRVQRLAREGWLGFEHDSCRALLVHRQALGRASARCWSSRSSASPLALRAAHAAPTSILAAFVLVYFVDLLTLRAHFDRYVLPLVPPLGALAGRLRLLAPVTLACLVVPLIWAIGDDGR